MKRIATIVINPETVSFALRDITGELFFNDFPTSRYDSVLEVLRDVARKRGTIDHAYIGGVWSSAYLGQRLSAMNWPTFRAEEVTMSTCNHVELTKDTDAIMAMLLRVQAEVSTYEQTLLAS